METSISQAALKLLLGLMGTPNQAALQSSFEGNAAFKELITKRFVVPAPIKAKTIYISEDDRDYDLEPNPDGPGYRYFSVEGWMHVEESRLARYRVNHRYFFQCLQSWVGLPNSLGVNELLADTLWDLGNILIGKQRIAVLFCRRAVFAETVFDLQNTLATFPRRRSALILTDDTLSPYGPPLPGEPVCVALADLLLPDQDIVQKIDTTLLAEMLDLDPDEQSMQPQVQCSEDGGHLIVNGQDYQFEGFTQRRIVRRLFDAWAAGQGKLRTSVVLEEVHSESRHMSQAFGSRDTRWRNVIGYGQGDCWLKTEPLETD